MALVYVDRVKETTTTTGTGTYTLAGAELGFQAFSTVGNGNTCYYAITDGTNWEVGLGTYTLSGTTLARTSVLASSNSGSAVSWSAGSKTIWLDYPADAISVAGALTLLGTLTTTSGTTQSLTGIPAGYTQLQIEVDSVSHDSGSVQSLQLELSSTNGAAYGAAITLSSTVPSSVQLFGVAVVYNIASTATNKIYVRSVNNSTNSGSIATNTGARVDAVRLSLSGGSFDAGEVRIYGVL